MFASTSDLSQWTVSGNIAVDSNRLTPDGQSSWRVEPGAEAVLSLRDASGRELAVAYAPSPPPTTMGL